MANSHVGDSGLQGWSCGKLYPWTIVVKSIDGNLYIHAMNCLSGVRRPSFSVNEMGFAAAHDAAEASVLLQEFVPWDELMAFARGKEQVK